MKSRPPNTLCERERERERERGVYLTVDVVVLRSDQANLLGLLLFLQDALLVLEVALGEDGRGDEDGLLLGVLRLLLLVAVEVARLRVVFDRLVQRRLAAVRGLDRLLPLDRLRALLLLRKLFQLVDLRAVQVDLLRSDEFLQLGGRESE